MRRLKKSTGVLLGGPKLRVEPAGGARVEVPNPKIPCPSRKNSRFSGKKRLNRVRLICCVSASTCAKSVFQVRSAVRPLVMPTFASAPKSPPKVFSKLPLSAKAPAESPMRYGLTSTVRWLVGARTPTRVPAELTLVIARGPSAAGTRVR